MEIDSYTHGTPSWVDLSTPNPAAAASFYSALFGWDVQVGPPEAGGYAIAHLRGRPVAGIGPQQNPGPPVWATYVNVDNADATLAKVEPAGGKVFMPGFDVMDVGRMGFFADPTGAVIGVWQPGTHKGAGIVNEPNSYCWSELVTDDIDSAKKFYGSVFGWGAMTHGEDTAVAYTEFQLDGHSIGGMMGKPPGMPPEVPSYWGVYFAVADADATVAAIPDNGGTVVMGPQDIEPGRFALATDPAGAMFSILKMNEG
jgi:predicted enzyme related to lactoylglutathione lyase